MKYLLAVSFPMKSIAVQTVKSHERQCGTIRRRNSNTPYQGKHNEQIEEFIALFAHELLTPLTCIIGWTQLVQNQIDPALIRQALDVIERNASRQRILIDELLGILQYRRGYTISFNARGIELWRLVEEIQELPGDIPEEQLTLEL